MPRPSKRLLIETCMEAGPLTQGQIADALEATHDTREMRAVMSLLECFIKSRGFAMRPAARRDT
jgi:hypothetical protein